MITEILLGLVLLALVVIAFELASIGAAISEWRNRWGSNPLPASDYHAKEIWKTAQEVAHYLALERRDKNEGK